MDVDKIKDTLVKQKPYLEEEYGVKSIGVFGSFVKNQDGSDSDVDILVEFNTSIGLLKFMNLEHYLEDLLGREVDLVMKSALKPKIGERILSEVQYL